MIKVVPAPIIVPGKQSFRYMTSDDQELFMTLDEAMEHEADLNEKKIDKKTVNYEQIWTIQEAINKAVAEHRVVRFIWKGDNASIKKGIVDIKDCKLMKPSKESNDVAVIPPGINDFTFNEVV